MTQNDVQFIQDALGDKCTKLLAEIIANNNFVQNAKREQTKESIEKEKE